MAELDEFLVDYDPAVQQLAIKLRTLLLEVFPNAVEQFDKPAKLIGYGFAKTYKGLVCAITLQKSYVNLMFSRGTELLDPHNLLEGTGKKARHVKIRQLEEIDNPALKELLKIAITTHACDFRR